MLSRGPVPAHGRSALLTLGRLPVALEIARALHGAGWRVVVAEPFAWHLCRLSRAVARSVVVPAPGDDAAAHADGLLRVIDEEDISLVVPVSEETLFVAALRDRLPAGVALACAPFEALLAQHDKWRFAETARELGLAVPATALASSAAAEDLAAAGAHVIKPRLSCAGVDVMLRARGGALPDGLRGDDRIVQRRLPGPSLCVSAIVIEGRARALVAYRGLIESGSVSVLFERVAMPAGVREFVERFVAASGHLGPVGFDFLADEAGDWHAIECNPRATSGLHLLEPATIADGLTGAATAFVDGALPIGTRRQEAWSTLVTLQGQALRGRFSRSHWRWFSSTRDIDWSRTDPLPFLGLFPINVPLLVRALRVGRPITELAMTDVGWYGSA